MVADKWSAGRNHSSHSRPNNEFAGGIFDDSIISRNGPLKLATVLGSFFGGMRNFFNEKLTINRYFNEESEYNTFFDKSIVQKLSNLKVIFSQTQTSIIYNLIIIFTQCLSIIDCNNQLTVIINTLQNQETMKLIIELLFHLLLTQSIYQ